jgi:hypothetical protein
MANGFDARVQPSGIRARAAATPDNGGVPHNSSTAASRGSTGGAQRCAPYVPQAGAVRVT